MTAKQQHREGAFRRWADEHNLGHCHLASHDCGGRLQAAHYIAVQRLKHEYAKRELLGHTEHPILSRPLDDWIADDRNSLLLCEIHHGRFDRLGLRIESEACHIAFARECGLDHLIVPVYPSGYEVAA